MTLEVIKNDITRIGHTCHSKDCFLEIFCNPDTANLEEILLRNILKCFGEEHKIVGTEDADYMDSISFLTNLPYDLFREEMNYNK